MVAGRGVIDDPHYTTPLYRKAEAARIIAVPAQTFRDWAVGYARKRLDGSQVVSAPIVTTLEPARPRGVSVPFVGLAEAYVVAAFTKAGLPMRRIRPAVLWLQEHIGLPQALASQQLQTDGAEVLWDFGRQSGDPADQDMVDPQYGSVDVVVDPWRNGGQPTVAGRGIRVADIVSRLNAQEPAEDVADDYDLTIRDVEEIRRAA